MVEKQKIITDTKELDSMPGVKKIVMGLALVKADADKLITKMDGVDVVIINDEATETAAIKIRDRIKNGKKLINKNMDFFIDPLDIIVKAFKERKKGFIKPLDEYNKLLADGIIDFANRIEAKRKADEAELQKKLDDEKKKKEADEKALADKLAAEKDEEKKADMQKELDEKKAEAPAVSEPARIETRKAPSGKKKTNMVDNWKGIVINKIKFIEYAVKNNLIDCLDINGPEINKLAKEHKDQAQIPGLEFKNAQYLGK